MRNIETGYAINVELIKFEVDADTGLSVGLAKTKQSHYSGSLSFQEAERIYLNTSASIEAALAKRLERS